MTHIIHSAVLQFGRSPVGSQLVSVEFFIDIKSFLSHYGPGVDSASNRNEYQEYFLGVKGGRCVRADNLPPSCAVVTKSGNLNFLETSVPLQACNGRALPLCNSQMIVEISRKISDNVSILDRFNERTHWDLNFFCVLCFSCFFIYFFKDLDYCLKRVQDCYSEMRKKRCCHVLKSQ